jgi:hypothetical protein
MKIIINDKKIELNRKIGNYTMFAGMITLVGGLIISINQIFTTGQNQNLPANSELMFNISTVAMFVGLLLTEISMYFNNRWGRKPSQDEKITLGLKGLDDRYAVYHYKAPVPTLVVGPAGIWILETMYQHGKIGFEKGQYRQGGVSWFTRVFYQEGIGRPDILLRSRIEDLERFIKKSLPDAKLPPIHAALIFTAPNVTIEVGDDAPFPTMHVEKLKDFIRRQAKEQAASPAEIQKLISALPTE